MQTLQEQEGIEPTKQGLLGETSRAKSGLSAESGAVLRSKTHKLVTRRQPSKKSKTNNK